MSLKQKELERRVEKLEKEVEDLKLRPSVLIPMPYYVPQPYFVPVYPYYPVISPQPYWQPTYRPWCTSGGLTGQAIGGNIQALTSGGTCQ